MRLWNHLGRLSLRAAVLLVLMAAEGAAYGDLIVGSYSSPRSDRPFTGSDYSNTRSRLLNPANFGPGGIVSTSVTIAPPIATATPAALSGYGVFVITEVDAGLSPAEIADIRAFVLGGGYLMLVTDSGPPASNAVNQMLGALDGGSALGFFGGSGAAGGQVTAPGMSPNGPFGDLAAGSPFATTPGATLTPGSSSTIVGRWVSDSQNVLLEIAPGALGPGSGGVLAMGDVLFMNFFIPPASLFSVENNAILMENFFARAAGSTPVGTIPEPSAGLLLAVGVLVLTGWRRCRR